MGFLDSTGLATLWEKIKDLIPTKTSELTNDSGFITNTGTHGVYYGTCDTAAATQAKVVTLKDATGFSLTEGIVVVVKFTYAAAASTMTMNVNSTGAKTVFQYGTTKASSGTTTTGWPSGAVVVFTYNGSGWVRSFFYNTTYSSMTEAEITAGTGTTARIITPARLKLAIETWAEGEANVQSDWDETDSTSDAFIQNKPSIPTKTSDLTNDSGFITDAGVTSFNGSTGAITYTAPVTSVNGSTGAVTISVPTMTSELTNDSGFVTPLLGSTGNRTPGEVLNALQNGKPVSISHYDDTFSLLSLESFNYSIAINGIIGCTIIEYGGSLYCYTLIGYVSNDTWVGSATTLAKATDIPSIPTNVSYFNNDAGYLTQHQDISGKADQTSIDILVDAIVNGIADGTIIESTMIRAYGDGVLIGESGSPVCAYVNANGSFDVVSVTWDGNSILSTTVLASYGVDGTVQQIKFESAIDSNGDSVAMQPDLDALEQRVATIENTDTIYGYKADEIETTRVKFVNEDTTVMVWSKEANGHLVLKKQ